MPGAAINKYFDTTWNRKIRDDLLFAIGNVAGCNVAIDCGCGAGADIAHLSAQGFTVHGFDVEEEAISRCKARFGSATGVFLSQSSFGCYKYPEASLVVADASLFFCPKHEFHHVWQKIYACLQPSGIFCGSFLGPEDTMSSAQYKAVDYWPDVCVLAEDEVRALFSGYEILRFTEHKSSGVTPSGEPHDWHIFSVVARKCVAGIGDEPLLPCEFQSGRLRRLHPKDLEAFRSYRAIPGLNRYQGWSPMSEEDSLRFITEMNAAPLFAPGKWIQLGIADLQSDVLMGDIGLFLSADGKTAEVGFTLQPSAQGRGIATGAVRAALQLLFSNSTISEVTGVADARNLPSIRLLERLGFQLTESRSTVFKGEACIEKIYVAVMSP